MDACASSKVFVPARYSLRTTVFMGNRGMVVLSPTRLLFCISSPYDMNVSYKSADKTQTLSNISETVESYKQFAMEDMLTNTSVQLDVNDYTYMDMAGNGVKGGSVKGSGSCAGILGTVVIYP